MLSGIRHLEGLSDVLKLLKCLRKVHTLGARADAAGQERVVKMRRSLSLKTIWLSYTAFTLKPQLFSDRLKFPPIRSI